MKLEKSNKYNEKKLLNSIKIILLSSTLLMGCSSVKAEEIKATPEPTPVATSTPTPIPTPEPTPELTDMQKLKMYKPKVEKEMMQISYLIYEQNGETKIVFVNIRNNDVNDGRYEVVDMFSQKALFSVPEDCIDGSSTEIDYSQFRPEQKALEGIKVIDIHSIMGLNDSSEMLGIEGGESPLEYTLDEIYDMEENSGFDFVYTREDYANYYLAVVPEEYRAYAVDYVDEYNPIYNKKKSK